MKEKCVCQILSGTTLGSEDYDDDVTPTPDYDYNSTFDYYLYSKLPCYSWALVNT